MKTYAAKVVPHFHPAKRLRIMEIKNCSVSLKK